MTTFVEASGHAVHVAVSGPPGAPAILLMHSLSSDLHVWDAQADALSSAFRVIRFDFRGHGHSELSRQPIALADLVGDALAVLDACGVQSAHVGGCSLGGLVAQALASRAPDRVRSLILCDTAMTFPPPELWRQRAQQVRAEGLASVVDGTMSRWVTPAYAATTAGRGLRTTFLRTAVEGYAMAAELLATADVSAETAKLRVPTLVIVGAQDPSTPVATAEAIQRAIAGATLLVIPDTLHLPLVERPEIVTEAIRTFVTPPDEDLAALGARIRSEVLGADHVARSTASATALDNDFVAFLTRTAWGGVWARPHFDRRTRSIVTIAILAALGREQELALHLRAIRNTGATAADVSELVMHVAVYAGIPAANAAMKLAKQVLE